VGRALELLAGSATAPSTTFTALTAFTGTTFNVRSFGEGGRAWLAQMWADHQVAGAFRIRSPRMHDNVQGVRLQSAIGRVQPLLPPHTRQPVYPSDQLTAEITGSAVAGDAEVGAALIYYEDLPGIDAQLASPEDVLPNIAHVVGVLNSISKAATIGFSGEEAIDENDLLKSGKSYAILGAYTDVEASVVRYRGPATGNLGVGLPGEPDLAHHTTQWFVSISESLGLPCIPVFNAGDRDNTLIDVGGDENAATVIVTTILAELG